MYECGSETFLQQIWLQHDHQFLNAILVGYMNLLDTVSEHHRSSDFVTMLRPRVVRHCQALWASVCQHTRKPVMYANSVA